MINSMNKIATKANTLNNQFALYYPKQLSGVQEKEKTLPPTHSFSKKSTKKKLKNKKFSKALSHLWPSVPKKATQLLRNEFQKTTKCESPSTLESHPLLWK